MYHLQNKFESESSLNAGTFRAGLAPEFWKPLVQHAHRTSAVVSCYLPACFLFPNRTIISFRFHYLHLNLRLHKLLSSRLGLPKWKYIFTALPISHAYGIIEIFFSFLFPKPSNDAHSLVLLATFFAGSVFLQSSISIGLCSCAGNTHGVAFHSPNAGTRDYDVRNGFEALNSFNACTFLLWIPEILPVQDTFSYLGLLEMFPFMGIFYTSINRRMYYPSDQSKALCHILFSTVSPRISINLKLPRSGTTFRNASTFSFGNYQNDTSPRSFFPSSLPSKFPRSTVLNSPFISFFLSPGPFSLQSSTSTQNHSKRVRSYPPRHDLHSSHAPILLAWSYLRLLEGGRGGNLDLHLDLDLQCSNAGEDGERECRCKGALVWIWNYRPLCPIIVCDDT